MSGGASPAGDPEVLVVGAGPVGLCTAIELARRGVRVRIVDRRTEPRTGTRACTVWQRTLEVFDLMGLPVGDYLDAGVPYTHRVHHFTGLPPVTRPADQPGTRYPWPLLIGQPATEEMLTRHLAGLGVRVERGLTAVQLTQGPARVTVRLAGADGSVRDVRAEWVVGAQGPHSSVRDGMGAAWEKTPCPGTQLLQIDARWTGSLPGDPAHCHLFLTEAGSLGTAPLPDGRHRFYAGVADPDPSRTGDPGVAEVLDAVRRVSGVPDLEFHDGRFHWRVRLYNAVAGTYRVGRCLLAGDSAHTVMPVTAQGMNTGVQDAFNLGWKLAAVVHGRAPARLLDTYEAERRPVALALAERNGRTYWGGVGPVPPFALLRSRLADAGAGHTGLTLGYPESALSAGPGAGERVPDAEWDGGRLFRLLGRGDWTVLAFPEDPADPAAAELAGKEASAGARRAGVPVHVVTADGRGPRGTVADGAGAVREALGARAGGLVLVRPDGYVAFRGAVRDGAALDRHLAGLLG
ncbi:FAD-dependent oxidoreductase [Streptomyces pseudogriseolus]|uniref:FAD-dependent oxidoreductase n=1 Tax=Streptomyces TaxID=1883 RepID=UPI0004CA4CAC|nr:FAD-dependent oxidoreductase [Streptomyces sp. NRRL F-5527]